MEYLDGNAIKALNDGQMIEKLIKIKRKNKELPIVTFTDTEVVCSDDYNSWMGSISDIDVQELYNDGEMIHLDDTEDAVRIEIENDSTLDKLTDNDFEMLLVNKIYKLKQQGKVYRAIVIRIGLPV